MTRIDKMKFATPVPDDLARKLKPGGVKEILSALWKSSWELMGNPKYQFGPSTEEDEITQNWYAELLELWYDRNRATCIKIKLTPIHQYADPRLKKPRGQSPTIDFCFRDWSGENSYFGVECKKLMNCQPNLTKRYMETGIGNYTSGRYGSHSSESCLVAYVMAGSVADEVEALSAQIVKSNPVSGLTRVVAISEPQYYSQHIRSLDNAVLTLHHLFLDFTQENIL